MIRMSNDRDKPKKKDQVKGFLGDRAAELLEDDEATSEDEEPDREEE